ncbi:MAG: hypothetical protein KC417_11120, partial [Myxococcales bacterium]|nr:hypothetical protein [Myxococcales bacterium]
MSNDFPGARERIAEHVSRAAASSAEVLEMARVSGGACQDIFRVVIEFDSGSLAGRHTFALRSDAPTSLAGSLDRRTEFEVVRSAAAAGVRTPAVHWLGTGLL